MDLDVPNWLIVVLVALAIVALATVLLCGYAFLEGVADVVRPFAGKDTKVNVALTGAITVAVTGSGGTVFVSQRRKIRSQKKELQAQRDTITGLEQEIERLRRPPGAPS